MGEIRETFPGLLFPHLGELAALVVKERNAVTAITQVYERARWGKGCLAYDVVRGAIEEWGRNGTWPWLRYIQEKGVAYTVVVDGAPLRIQPDIAEIREMMSGEAAIQAALFPEQGADDERVLRLEVAHRAGQDVRAVALCLYNAKTGKTLDQEPLYCALPSSESESGNLVPLSRPPTEADISGLFTFHATDDAKGDGTK